MGNSVSDKTLTVLCKCGAEMKSTTPSDIYQRRIPCCYCKKSIAHAGIMFHCNKSNKYHKNGYDLCEQCAKKKAIKVFCKNCNKIEMDKISLKNNNLKCNQCNKNIQISKSNKYIYHCQECNTCNICISCAKNPSIMHHKQKEYIDKVNKINEKSDLQQRQTTLHGYDMIGPYTPDKNMVWYCDNKTCQYTKHGLYRKYRIQNWRSSQFGKKFVLCDGCVRQYEKQKIVIVQPQVNVEVNIGNNFNDNNGNDIFHRSETEIINQPEGIISSNTSNLARTMTYM